MRKENLTCGIPVEKIRKAYFKGKIDKLLNELQAEKEYAKADYEELAGYLEFLKKTDTKINDQFAAYIPKIITEDSPDMVLDELNRESLSKAEIAELDKEKDARSFAVRTASKMLKDLFKKFYNPKEQSPDDEFLMDMAFELLGLQYYLTRDALYKERLFRKQITEFERSGKQRKLAEEYAKCGMAYRDYSLAEGLKEQVQEFINLVKKRYRQM